MYLKRLIPNALSLLRIVLSFVLLLTVNAEWLFLSLVIVIGLSDVADGYLARKYKVVSTLGAKLDSIADLTFFAIIFVVICLKYTWILTDNYGWFSIIVFMKVCAAILSRVKHGEFIFLHTIANKITGLIVFLSIIVLPFNFSMSLYSIVFIISTVAATEEFGIMLLSKEIDPNQKTILKKGYFSMKSKK